MDMRIEGLYFNSEKNSVSCFVKGSELYNTSVIFKENGDARRYRCDCKFNGLCKHVVALMLEIKGRDSDGEFDKSYIKSSGNMSRDFER